MKKRLIILAILAAGGLLLYFTLFSGGNDEIRLLVFSKTAGYRHESIEAGRESLEKIARKNNYTVQFTEDSTFFTEENLKGFHAIVFLSTSGDILNPEQQVQLERYIQAGGGFAGVHAASTTEYAWPWYGKLVGGYFAGHPNDPNVRKATVEIVNPNHSATDSLPSRWEREDEWYNFKALDEENQVLINVDESTYEGGTHNGDHPIAWFKEYDGGRSFYTALGHTSKSYSDPLFLKHLEGGIKYAVGPGLPPDYSRAYAQLVPEENRFTKVTFLENLNEPMELDFLSSHEILFVERKGGMHIYNLLSRERKHVIDFPVFSGLEDGLLGVAVDPDYELNNFVYLFYSAVDKDEQRVSRFVLRDGVLDMASENILLEIPVQRESCCHSAGSLEFGPGRMLFISVGDNTNPHESGGYSPSDERPGRAVWDAQKSASNAADLRGKILRIQLTDDGYEIPEGNLFASDAMDSRPEIYVMGNRNPYRIAVDQKNGALYWGEVGPDASLDSVGRGPRGYDEFNRAAAAGNYGWPYFIGANFPYTRFNFERDVSGELFDHDQPRNSSPNNTGRRELPEAQPALIYYPYDAAEPFGHLGTGSRNAMAGPVFYHDMYEESDIRFPDFFDGKPLFYDWMRQWIYVVSLTSEGALDGMARIVPNMDFSNIIDMAYGPDGALYILEYGGGWFSQNPDAALSRIEYTEGNRKPVARLSASKTVGAVPLEVTLSAQNSIDFDGDALSYQWELGDGSESAAMNLSHTFESPGIYEVLLTVTDETGQQSIVRKEIIAGNDRPEVAWTLAAGNRSFYFPGEPVRLQYSVEVTDTEDGSLASGEIDPGRVILSVNYLAEGQDMVQAYMDHQGKSGSVNEGIGKVLVGESDCLACHKESDESIGPSFKAIADKYQVDAEAEKYLSLKIINGGSGVWGETPMAAHPGMSEADALEIVKYIRSFAPAQPVASRLAPSGTFDLKDHITRAGGTYIVTASYTDDGGENVSKLSDMKTFFIRSPRVQAENYDGGQAMKVPVKADDVPGVDEDMTIVVGQEGAFLQYSSLDLTGIGRMKMKIGLAATFTKGGYAEVRVDGLDGPLIGRAVLEQGLATFGIEEYILDLSAVEGVHDVFLVFTSDDPGNEKPVAVIDWLEFNRNEKL